MTGEKDTQKIYPIGSADGQSEAKQRIAEAQRTSATKLDLGGLGLEEVPSCLFALRHLEVLNLGRPEDLSDQALDQALRKNEYRNNIRALPLALFTSLVRLQLLNLAFNELLALPAEIGQLTELEDLSVSGNQLTSLPAEIGRLAKLRNLTVRGNQLTSLPAEIGLLAKLEHLDLIENQLTSLPAEIGKLAELKRLSLGINKLTSLPAEIGSLAKLEELYLYQNQLTSLPAEIDKLAELETLQFSENQFTSLPPVIWSLAKLKRLYPWGNQLTSLPAEIGELTQLEILNLEGNQLTSLPVEIGGLGKLSTLILGGNRLPPWFEKALNEGGVESLQALLRAYENAAPLFEAKLLVTGAGKVGKSWAFARLRREDPHEAVGEQTTYGVYCGELRLPHPSAGQGKVPAGAEIHLNTWDFGGQDVYRITHQFFFTQDAIFLLVWNPRDGAEKCGVREWLRMIELRTGGNAKVIMVASHSPRGRESYRADYGRDRLPKELSDMIVDEIAIDSELGDNIPELRAMIARHAAGLRFMGDPFPVTWQKARQAVAALNPDGQKKQTPHITYERFQALCRESGVPDEEQMFTLATVFMHNLGRTIYYGDRHRMTGADPLLANIMVLDSEWLSRAFVQVLEDKATNESGGMFDHAWLDRIWLKHGRTDWQRFTWDEHPFLIRLMHAFDVSYVVSGSDGRRSLVPQLLPATEPDLPWRSPPNVNGVMPVRLICRMENEAHGLMPRFIVQTAPYHCSCKAFWRDGVFLREPTYGNEALVTLEGTEKPVMTTAVSGAQPSWFLGELHRTLLELLNFWPGLKRTFYIGCPTRLPDGSFCKGAFKFDFVVTKYKSKPDQTHDCQECCESFTPRELLSGYRALEELQTLQAVQAWSLAKEQAPCPRAFTLVPADRSKYDPRKFAPDKIAGKKLKLTLLSEHSLKEVVSKEFGVLPGWVKWIGPLARIGSLALNGMALPMTGLEAKEFDYAAKVMKDMGSAGGDGALGRHAKKVSEDGPERADWPSGADLEDLHKLLQAIDLAPHFGEMQFVKIRSKGYLWVSKEEAEAFAEQTPTLAYIPRKTPT